MKLKMSQYKAENDTIHPTVAAWGQLMNSSVFLVQRILSGNQTLTSPATGHDAGLNWDVCNMSACVSHSVLCYFVANCFLLLSPTIFPFTTASCSKHECAGGTHRISIGQQQIPIFSLSLLIFGCWLFELSGAKTLIEKGSSLDFYMVFVLFNYNVC